MEVNQIILWIYLLVGSVWDWKERKIPVWFCLLAAGGVVLAGFYQGDLCYAEKIGGVLIGVMLCIASKLTGGQIGMGDGITFLISGLAIGFESNFLLLFEALLLTFLWSLFSLVRRKINLKSRIPFLPFVLAAFIWQAIESGYF